MEVACEILLLLLLPWLASALGGPKDVSLHITRQNVGDLFNPEGMTRKECLPETCVGLSSGTAGALPGGDLCTCQCHSHLPAFREDLRICVDDIHECVLAPFVGGSTSQQIPFVFLPLKGQIIHPSKEISFAGIQTPVCAVSGAKFLTEAGWVDLRSPLDTDVPLRLFRDEGRTFLQWVGEPELRMKMSGRLVLVYLMCRELASPELVSTPTGHTLFSPCVAFRVVGSPTKYLNNVSEVAFSSDQPSTGSSDHLSVSEYIAIGICSVLLGLIYVASVFLYLHLRKRNKSKSKKSDVENLPQAEESVVKSNPLLTLAHFQPPDNVYSDSTNSDTELPPDILQNHDDRKKTITSAVIHQQYNNYNHSKHNNCMNRDQTVFTAQDSNNMEKIPEENVSIVETLDGRDDRMDNFRALSGTVRRKLYFNPAYFEPQLLLAPPPAALEFLSKIREVIHLAKQKMNAKRFAPSLMGIPEEETNYALDNLYDYSRTSVSRRSSVISLKRENSRRKTCTGCPGCEPQDLTQLCGKLPEFPNLAACNSCAGSSSSDSKQRSIRKWLEDVPTVVKREDNNLIDDKLDKQKITKRLRSPTRSLPADKVSRALSPKPKSERGLSPKSYQRRFFKATKAPQPPMNLPPPDMINEALVVDNNKHDQDTNKFKTMQQMKKVIDELNINQQAVDSSPESLKKKIVDYETDSLERSGNKGYHTPSEYGDLSSSQPSPSLSAALPMDEELTMRNAIFNKKTGNMTISKINVDILQDDDEHDYELIVLKKGSLKKQNFYKLPELLQNNNDYSFVSEVYVNNGYNYNSAPSSPSTSNCSTLDKRTLKISYEEGVEKPGKLLIEVEDCPDHYIPCDDSDNFEPDTLDRKPIKKVENQSLVKVDDDYVDSLERPHQILLKSSGSFKKLNNNTDESSFNRVFGSLREIYEAKQKIKPTDDDEGRLLTLEQRHSKRQRNLIPPDVIPPPPHNNSPIYEHPKPPRKVLIKPPLPPKNGIGRSAQDKSGTPVIKPQFLQDSGYLSTDKGSDSGDSFEDGRSESGAESVETHSVFFGSLRKNIDANNNNNRSSNYANFGSMDSGVEITGRCNNSNVSDNISLKVKILG